MADLEGLLASAASFAAGVDAAAVAADQAAASGGDEAAPDPLLAVNIFTSSAVDAANLQKVLTFLVSSVQSLAASCASSEASQAAAEDKLSTTTTELTSLRERFDALSGQVGGLASDESAAEGTAQLQAALKASEDRAGVQLQEMETRLTEAAQASRAAMDAALEAARGTASAELKQAREAIDTAIDEQGKAATTATVSVTEGLAAAEAGMTEQLAQLQALVESARTDSQSEIEGLREFVKTGLQAAAEGKEVPTELPHPNALATEAAMKDQLAAATADCATLREQLGAVQEQQQTLERGLDPLPASIKELAQIVGSITANTDRAERRSQLLQEQVEDLHARWNDAGQVIDEAYSRPGSAFSRPGSALDSDGTMSASHSRPGTRELAFPEPDGLASEFGSRPKSVQRPQSQHNVSRVEEVIEEEDDDAVAVATKHEVANVTNVTNMTEVTEVTHVTRVTNVTEVQAQEQQQQAAVSAAVPDVSQMSPVEQIVVAEVQAEMEAEIAAEVIAEGAPTTGMTTMPVLLPPAREPAASSASEPGAPDAATPSAIAARQPDPSIAKQERVAPVTRVVVAAAKAAEESTGAQLERTVTAASATGGRRRRRATQHAEPPRDLASVGLQRLMAEVETQAVRLADLEASMKEFSELPPGVPAPLVEPSPAPAPAPAPPPVPAPAPPPAPEPQVLRPVTPTRPATPTGTEMMAAVQAQIAASEERMRVTEQEQRESLKSEIERLEAELAATKTLREEVAQQQAGLQAAKDADARLATQMAALEQQFSTLPAPAPAPAAPAPAPAPAPVPVPIAPPPGVDPAALNEMSEALRASMAEQTTELGKSLRNQMFDEVDTLKHRLEEVSSSIPGQVEAVADGLEDIRRALSSKADTGAIRQLEGIIGQLQAMTEKKQLPGSNSPPMSPAPPPRRYQVPPTITARIISPDLNDIRDALGAIRSGLSAKADTEKLDKMMKTLGPRMKELGSKLKEVDSLSTSLRRNSGTGLGLEVAATGGGGDTLSGLEEAVKKVKEEHPDRSEAMALSHEISSKHSNDVVHAFRGELGAHEERLFNGLCGTFREYAVGLGRLMREELDTLRTNKADRVDIKRLEHILSARIADLSATVDGGGTRRASTGAVFPSMLPMDIRGGSANESLEDMQARLEESLGMLRKMYEKDGWGVRSLSPTKSNGGSGGKSSLGGATSSSTNVSFTQFELPGASSAAAGTHTTGPAGLPRPRSTPLSRLGQFDDGRNRAASRGAPGGADLGISNSTLGGGGTTSSFDSSVGLSGESRRSSRGLRSRGGGGSRGAPARLQPLQR